MSFARTSVVCERLERERDAGPELGPGGVHRRAPSRRTSSSPLVNGLSIRGVELSSLAPAEAWNELVLIFEASSRLLDPARGSRRSWGVRSDARRGTPSAFAVRAARVARTAVGNADARRRVRRARRVQTQIYNRVEGHKNSREKTSRAWRDDAAIRFAASFFYQTGRTSRSTPAEARAFKKPTANSRSFRPSDAVAVSA